MAGPEMNIRDESGIKMPTLFAGLRGFGFADIPREVSAGLTLAALVVPLNIGYPQIAGLPAALGLYAAIAPLVVFAIFPICVPHLRERRGNIPRIIRFTVCPGFRTSPGRRC